MIQFKTKRDWFKLLRSILEAGLLLILLFFVLRVFLVKKTYVPYDKTDTSIVTGNDAGFITISFFGVDRTGTDTLISTERMREQLQALRNSGYVTITQQDIIDYYEKGKPLPEKALFLLFEDGRMDTAIFSEPILEEFNFIGTICSYGEKLGSKDSKFLTEEDLISLQKTSFWELGTNGYRLSYINVFDRYDRFLGEMTSNEFIEINEYLGRNYNHYLMDYIRDENSLPVESYSAMEERITYDYQQMEKLYTEKLGYLPVCYVLMHSNTNRFGNNERVSQVNENCMTERFPMNFNRESFAVNKADTNEYNLTRLQSQAYWYTNHLLMRIWDDLDEDQKAAVVFVDGDKTHKAAWKTTLGVSEFRENAIVVTSLPKSRGRIWLKDSSYQDVHLSTELTGNLIGEQTIYLRADDELSRYLSVSLREKRLIVRDSGEILTEVDLDELMGVSYLSLEEDSRDALAAEYQARADYAGTVRESTAYQNESNAAKKQQAKSVADGAEPYIPELEINDMGDWLVEISLHGDSLSVTVNDRPAVENLTVRTQGSGSVCLESACIIDQYSQRNLSDDVYDGVFEDLKITEYTPDPEEAKVLYDDQLHGWDLVWHQIRKWWTKTINWFVANL